MSRKFKQASDKINCGQADVFVAGRPVTIVFWVNLFSSASIVMINKGSTNFDGPILFSQGTSGDIEFRMNGSTDFLRRTSGTGGKTKMTFDRWNSVALTHDGSVFAANSQIYINLIQGVYSTTQDGANLTDNGSQPLMIGNNSSSGNFAIFGHMAYVQIFNKVLSFDQIRQATLYPGSIRDSLGLFLPLFGDSNLEPDLSGSSNHGIVTGPIKGETEPPIAGIFNPSRRMLYSSYTLFVPPPPKPPATIIKGKRMLMGVGL